MPLPEHPAVANILDHLERVGQKGLRTSVLLEVVKNVQPYPPPIVIVQQLVDAGYARASPAPVTTESLLVITDAGEAALAARKNAGAWISEELTITPRKALTEAGILAFLRSVERGEVTLAPETDPNAVYAGTVSYSASNGWRLAVFNDANVWDYIEWIEANGERVTFEEIEGEMPGVLDYAPSAEVAEAAYEIPRVTTKRASAADDLGADARAFQELHDVLSGKRRLGLDGASSKMLRIILGGGDTDTVITPERFVVHFGPRRQRVPSRYSLRLAPRMMSELLARAAIEAVEGPVVVGLPAGTVPKTTGAFPEWSYDARLIRVVPGTDAVKVIVRGSPEQWTRPLVQPVPKEGILEPRELPEWAPSEVAYTELATDLSCPRCGTAARRYRQIRGALVCLSCGRSLQHGG
ncbi:MAG: hypothetical protein JST00_34340 [Deltaproteobacteria bacterium]|nr:hypothetical protein [Deltaproteobacteria bacterium]